MTLMSVWIGVTVGFTVYLIGRRVMRWCDNYHDQRQQAWTGSWDGKDEWNESR